MTPLGWARSNMMYEMMREPPPPGSPLESLMIIVWRMREDIRYHEIRTLVQASIDPDDGKSTKDAWGELTDVFYPYLKGKRRRDDRAALEFLMREVKKGAFGIRPLAPLHRSKIRRRAERNADRG